jgi:hypothetical protein
LQIVVIFFFNSAIKHAKTWYLHYLFLLKQVLDGFGRKTVMIASQLLGGACCVAAALVNEDWLVTVLSLVGENHSQNFN